MGIAYLHIGMHKTGSTSIQYAFANYKDEMTEYCDVAGHELGHNHSVPIITAFSKHDAYRFYQDLDGDRIEKIAEKSEWYKKKYCEYFQKNRDKNIIISGEDMSAISDEGKKNLVQTLGKYGFKVKVICIVRNPLSAIPSVIQQLVQSGSSEISFNLVWPDYLNTLDGFNNILSCNDLIVENYDELVGREASLVQWFADQVGASGHFNEVAQLNAGLSQVATKLVYRFNRLIRPKNNDNKTAEANKRLIELLTIVFPKKNYGPFRGNVSQFLTSRHVAELNELKSKYKIDFGIVTKLESYQNEFEDTLMSDLMLDLTQEEMRQLRILSPFEFPSETTIDAILTGIYVNLLETQKINEFQTDSLRDAALAAYSSDHSALEYAISLMSLARRGRPDESFITQTLQEWKKCRPIG